MKNSILALFLCFFVTLSCKKTSIPAALQVRTEYVTQIQSSLKDSLSAIEYATLDFIHAQQIHVDSANIHLLRIPLLGKDIVHDFLVVRTNRSGIILQGSFIHILRKDTATTYFNGWISHRSLKGIRSPALEISNGYIIKRKPTEMTLIEPTMPEDIIDGGDLPDVIVYASISGGGGGGYNWGDYYNLSSMLNAGSGSGYSSGGNYYSSSSGSGTSTPAVLVDVENSENSPAIDVKKYMNCFGTISNVNATCLITIATDIPVDGDPSQFFNWNTGSPGHSFITLFKMDGRGNSIEQTIGFYPNSSWKTVAGFDIASKTVDNAWHEYNAKYTIAVSPGQFQAAINAVQTLSSKDYNMDTFNCTDFSLGVFNAGGGNLSIPQYQIPGYPNGNTGSNTPQGLYNQLNTMAGNGNPGIKMPGIKGYTGDSHGPCN
jgi:hypothetical protein